MGSLRSAAEGNGRPVQEVRPWSRACCNSAGARTPLSAPGGLVGRPVRLQENPESVFPAPGNGSQVVGSDLFRCSKFVLRGEKTWSLEEQRLEVSAPLFPWVRPRGIVERRRPPWGRAVVWATRGIYTYKEEPVAFIFKKLSQRTYLKHTLIFHYSTPSLCTKS